MEGSLGLSFSPQMSSDDGPVSKEAGVWEGPKLLFANPVRPGPSSTHLGIQGRDELPDFLEESGSSYWAGTREKQPLERGQCQRAVSRQLRTEPVITHFYSNHWVVVTAWSSGVLFLRQDLL